MSYHLVENTSAKALPAGAMPKQAKQRMYSLQRRAHLTYFDDHTKREPLTDEEREELELLEEQWRDQHMPKAGPYEYPFAPKGQPGSIWRVHEMDLPVLLTQHPTRLRQLNFGEEPPIRPYEHGQRLSIAEMTPGSSTEEASRAATVFNDRGEIVGKGGNMVAAVAMPGPNER